MLPIITVSLFILYSYMFFLMFISSSFLRYELRQNGFKNPASTFIGKYINEFYKKREPLIILPITKVGYFCHNKYQKITVNIPGINRFEKLFYKLGLYFYKNTISKIIFLVIGMLLISGSLSIYMPILQTILSVIVVFDIITFSYCIFNPSLKNTYDYYHNMYINYLLLFKDNQYYKHNTFVKHSNYFLSFYPKIPVKRREWYQASDYDDDVSLDQSVFKLKNHTQPTRRLPVISPVALALAINGELKSKYQCNGGINMYNNIDFIKIDNRSYAKSNGMMTYLDGYDLVPKGCSIRDVDANAARNIRRKSKVPGLYEDTKQIFDRTHLVHHRLSGCEGGLGTMVPMYKSVNTGTNSLFHGRVSKEPVKNSMKYYEDFAINYLNKHPKDHILYVSDPYYISDKDIIPSHVKIRIYVVKNDKVFLLKKGKVFNIKYLFKEDKDHKFKIDSVTGHATFS